MTEVEGTDDITSNEKFRGPGLVRYGPSHIKSFCENNKVTKIFRAHEMVMDGYAKHYSQDLWTIFSAANYGGNNNNDGAMVIIDQEGTISFKCIHPVENPH